MRLFFFVSLIFLGTARTGAGEVCYETSYPERPCGNSTGKGVQMCGIFNGELSWGPCLMRSCNTGFELNEDKCVPQNGRSVTKPGCCLPGTLVISPGGPQFNICSVRNEGTVTPNSLVSGRPTCTGMAELVPVGAPPPVLPPGVAVVDAESTDHTREEVGNLAASSSGSQHDSQRDAGRVLSLGADHAATLGAVYCAEGANKFSEDPEQSTASFAACDQNFKSALEMQALQGRAGVNRSFQPDPAVLSLEGAKNTLEDFRSKFGISSEDYLKKMLSSGGNRGEFGEMLSSQIPAEKFTAAWEAASELKAEASRKYEVSLSRGGTGKKTEPSLRDVVKGKLARAGREPAELAREGAGKAAQGSEFDHLDPLDSGKLFGAKPVKPASAELTLFDVVHSKYSDITQRSLISSPRGRSR